MRITFIASTLNLSGGIRVIAIYAQHLLQMGHDVLVVSPSPQSIPLVTKLKSIIRGKGWPQIASTASHLDSSNIPQVVIDRWRPIVDSDIPDADVVIATWWRTAEWVNALSPSKGAKVYFVQGYEIFPYLPVDRCHASYRLPLKKIVVARWLADTMRSAYGDNDVTIVPNSVDRRLFSAPARDRQSIPTIGLTYSTASIKGVDMALRALHHAQEASGCKFRVISFGSERPTKQVPLPPNAEFHLRPPQDRIRDLYAQCDAWLTASRSEGFNLSAMEAMACRTPVISTRTGWPAEALRTGYNGALVDVDDCAGLARSIHWLMTLPKDDWRKLSDNSLATASRGSWDESAKLFENALTRAAKAHQAKPSFGLGGARSR